MVRFFGRTPAPTYKTVSLRVGDRRIEIKINDSLRDSAGRDVIAQVTLARDVIPLIEEAIEIHIGRSEENQIAIADLAIDLEHAMLIWDGAEATIVNLSSDKQIGINSRLEPSMAVLEHGDIIKLSEDIKLTFEMVGIRSDLPAVRPQVEEISPQQALVRRDAALMAPAEGRQDLAAVLPLEITAPAGSALEKAGSAKELVELYFGTLGRISWKGDPFLSFLRVMPPALILAMVGTAGTVSVLAGLSFILVGSVPLYFYFRHRQKAGIAGVEPKLRDELVDIISSLSPDKQKLILSMLKEGNWRETARILKLLPQSTIDLLSEQKSPPQISQSIGEDEEN